MISPPLAQVLAAGRRQFNQRVDEARRRTPGFDPAAFSAFVQQQLDPVVSAVEAVAPARTAGVTLAAYDIGLLLCAQGLAGPSARSRLVNQLWREVLPALAPRIAELPHDLLGALSNAAVHLGTVDGARPAEWLGLLRQLGPGSETPAQLLALGKVLAWRAGLAQFRPGALQAAASLPDALQRAALQAPSQSDVEAWRGTLASSPWAGPQARPEGWTLGGFTGFDGRFAAPPALRVASNGMLVRSGDRYFLAIADACGAVLMPATAQEFDLAAPPKRPASVQWHGQTLVVSGREVPIDLPQEGLVLAASPHTLAVASPYTHTVRLLPL
ncbi:hypothetical protein CDN98_21590 [Roseateles terrae]|nr:hypothetical protein CDN98_21590 [Roseateles terrae]